MDMTDEELSAEYDRLFKEFSGRDPPRDDEGADSGEAARL
jgi:hypothetical protein